MKAAPPAPRKQLTIASPAMACQPPPLGSTNSITGNCPPTKKSEDAAAE